MSALHLDQVLAIAVRHHQDGRLAEAETIYRQVLQEAPSHAPALDLLGALAAQTGRSDEAVALLRRAIALSPALVSSHFNLGQVLRNRGQFAEAAASYRQVLRLQPGHAQACNFLGESLAALNQAGEASAAFRAAIQHNPDYARAHNNLGNALARSGQFDQAVASFREALRLKPDFVDGYGNLGNALAVSGRVDEAIAVFRQGLRLKPDHAALHHNLASALSAGRRDAEALAAFREAVRLKPGFAAAHLGLGNVLLALGRPAEAEPALREAIRLEPTLADAYGNLGAALKMLGRDAEALPCYQKALQLKPDLVEAHGNLGTLLQAHGHTDEALAAYDRALALNPAHVEIAFSRAVTLAEAGRWHEAIAAYGRVIAQRPTHADAFNNLGIAHRVVGQVDEAEAAFRAALSLKPAFADAHSNLGIILDLQGRRDEALACYRRAVDLSPASAATHSNLLYALHFHPASTPQSLLEEHRHWSRRHADPLHSSTLPHPHDHTPDRRLRIAYISPDFRDHPVGRFMLPVMAAHDHAACEIFCYADLQAADAITAHLQRHADQWRAITGMTDQQVADLIRRDRIDILVDLTMHMSGNRLLVFARKPAPIQVTYLAYCSTTGLPTMDYRLTDGHLDPPDSDTSGYTEESVRLAQSYWCYAAPPGAPPVNELPARKTGAITFGCLNGFSKVSDQALALWANILQAVPGSRLLLHANPGRHRARITRFLAGQGLDPARCTFAGVVPLAEYLQLYHNIDIALDPFPYAGGTTTCDALWMGVPVVTLRGAMAVGRSGVSILSNLGMPELIADNPDAYVQIASRLASDLPALARLRGALRTRMQASPLMDAARFARDMEAAYRRMWRTWCAGPHAQDVASPSSRAPPDPTSAEAGYHRGNTLARDGQLDQAIDAYRQALALRPELWPAHNNLGNALAARARMPEAIAAFQDLLRLQPDFAEGYQNLGHALLNAGRRPEALDAFRHALRLKPDDASACTDLGLAHQMGGQLDEARACFAQALHLQPNHPAATATLAAAHCAAGEPEQALALYRQALAGHPEDSAIHSALLITLNYSATDPAALDAEARRWAQRHAAPLTPIQPHHPHDRNPDRPLRIGYASPDFREHPVGLNLLPLFHAHDRTSFHITCYARVARPDDITDEFRGLAHTWRNIAGLADDRAAQLMRDDRIDILIDLALHSSGNSLLVFARKPAPLQVTFAGYPGTTGMSAMDYRLTDPHLDPPDAGAITAERPLRLPETFWCYDPRAADIPVSPLPAPASGIITFGCLGNFAKVNAPTLQLWARILQAVPGSRLLLLAPEGAHRRHTRDLLARANIAPERLEFVPFQPRRAYLQLYHHIDIGLDTLPYNGHTTSLDAYYMGVPVMTLVGPTIVGRAGLSHLANLGLTDLIARTPDDYVHIATALAADLPRLARLRASFRQRMQSSPLMDGPRFARAVEAAYRRIWQDYCAAAPSSGKP